MATPRKFRKGVLARYVDTGMIGVITSTTPDSRRRVYLKDTEGTVARTTVSQLEHLDTDDLLAVASAFNEAFV